MCSIQVNLKEIVMSDSVSVLIVSPSTKLQLIYFLEKRTLFENYKQNCIKFSQELKLQIWVNIDPEKR